MSVPSVKSSLKTQELKSKNIFHKTLTSEAWFHPAPELWVSAPVVRVDSTDFAARDSSEPADFVSALVVESAGAETGFRAVVVVAVVIAAAAVSWAK
jgi:hypothetical protein